MQTAFLVINRNTQAPEYLEQRSIVKITKFVPSLTSIDIRNMEIVDVDKFIYVYYASNESDLQFRADMNMFRQLVNSAFFHAQQALFVLVDDKNPLTSDLIYSACRDSELRSDNIEIIHHEGALMLDNLTQYISGSSIGDTTSSTYNTVYITEADKEERVRYENGLTGTRYILPQLTDMAAMYRQRARNEAVSTGRKVTESYSAPEPLKQFTAVASVDFKETVGFVISGEEFSGYEFSSKFLSVFLTNRGKRVMVVSIDPTVSLGRMFRDATMVSKQDIQVPYFSEKTTSYIELNFASLSYFITCMDNIKSIDYFVFLVQRQNFAASISVINQLCDKCYSIFVSHYREESMRNYLDMGVKTDTLFMSRDLIDQEFDASKYRKDVKGTICALFPSRYDENVDLAEFYQFCLGGDYDE